METKNQEPSTSDNNLPNQSNFQLKNEENIIKEEDPLEEFKDIQPFEKILEKAAKTPKKIKSKVSILLNEINQGGFYTLDGSILQRLLFQGVPDEIPALRTLLWKLALNYPKNTKIIHSVKFNEEISAKRELYRKLVQQHYKLMKSKKATKISGDPLSKENSNWSNYFEDIDLLEIIQKDVRRTRTHMSFFFMPADTSKNISNTDITNKADMTREQTKPSYLMNQSKQEKLFETNADIMTRILFIYGKEYPDLKYIQGMNEILAPIYYQFCLDSKFDQNLEADIYFCFENLMEEIKELFIREMDEKKAGIISRIKEIKDILEVVDNQLFKHFKVYNVEIQYFMFRWFALMFTQEFEIPDVLRLWDSILSFVKIDCNKVADKFEFLNFLCIAIMVKKREEVLDCDFAGIMLTYQNLEDIDIINLIDTAMEMLLIYKDDQKGNGKKKGYF